MEPWLVATATVTLSNVDIIKTEHLQKYKVLCYKINSLKMSRSQISFNQYIFHLKYLGYIITFNKLINLVNFSFITGKKVAKGSQCCVCAPLHLHFSGKFHSSPIGPEAREGPLSFLTRPGKECEERANERPH